MNRSYVFFPRKREKKTQEKHPEVATVIKYIPARGVYNIVINIIN
jgi:hypothetical protein